MRITGAMGFLSRKTKEQQANGGPPAVAEELKELEAAVETPEPEAKPEPKPEPEAKPEPEGDGQPATPSSDATRPTTVEPSENGDAASRPVSDEEAPASPSP